MFRLAWAQEVPGSNPGAPTTNLLNYLGLFLRRYFHYHPTWEHLGTIGPRVLFTASLLACSARAQKRRVTTWRPAFRGVEPFVSPIIVLSLLARTERLRGLGNIYIADFLSLSVPSMHPS